MRGRIFFKLFGGALAVIVVATATLDFAVSRAWQRSLGDQIELALTQKAQLFAGRVRNVSTRGLAEMVRESAAAAAARATVIDHSGRVLADSEADPAHMENHAARPEFARALAGGVGSDRRLSHTVGIEFLYVAVPVEGGAVRLAYPLSAIAETTARVRSSLWQASLLALLIAGVLAAAAAHSVARRLRRMTVFAERIASGDLSARVAETALDEIGQVAAALDRTATRLEQSFAALEDNRRQLEALLNSLQEGVIAVAHDERLVWSNRAMRRTLPAARAGSPIVEVARDPEVLSALRHALTRGDVARATTRSLAPGRIFEITAAPLPGIGALAAFYDVTELERLEKTRRDFIANVSHELRTPLTSIQGYAETLMEATQSDGHAREFLEVIRKNAERMARLTEDLLTLARVESGEHKLEIRLLPASDLLADALNALEKTARAQGTELSIAESSEQPVEADADAIHQVFANLINNALKYAAGGRVEIGARPANGGVEFYVRDYGPGIASEHLPRLFERFYRVDAARSRQGGGTGLGLAIVKHIVLNHGGNVRAESRLGHGSTFFFTLPGVVPVGVA